MSDNPFAQPDDSDRTVIRPVPGGSAPAAAGAAAACRRRALTAARPRRGAGPGRWRRDDQLRPQSAGRRGGAAAAAAGPAAQHAPASPTRASCASAPSSRCAASSRRARDGGVPADQLRPAHYALCASLDDVVLNTPWGSSGGLGGALAGLDLPPGGAQRRALLRRCSTRCRQNPGTFLPVIELMYLCLCLGFQGQYRLSPRGPGELDRMREEIYALIARQRQAAEPELSPHWQGVPAPYRRRAPSCRSGSWAPRRWR